MIKNSEMTNSEALKMLEVIKFCDVDERTKIKALDIAIDMLRDQIEPSAHWIFSGDPTDYDGYYINCSSCGIQRNMYDRDCEKDIPAFCPSCGVRMNLVALTEG